MFSEIGLLAIPFALCADRSPNRAFAPGLSGYIANVVSRFLKLFRPARGARLLLILWLATGLVPGWSTAAPTTNDTPAGAAPASPLDEALTAPLKPLKPGPDASRVAHLVARMLQQNHYSRMPFDDRVSARFFRRYLDDLDPQHLHFLQSDVAELESYRTSLDDMILRRGDTTAAYEIFARFRERLQQRVAFALDLLQGAPPDFTTNERVLLNRKDAPFPENLVEAQTLWRQRLHAEYLQEKLNHLDEKKAATARSGNAGSTNEAPARLKTPEDIHAEIVKTLTRRYQRILRTFKDWEADEVLEAFLNSLARVYDPHTAYLGRPQTENFAISMNLQLFGIGAVLTTDEDGYCKIQELKPGPALRSKQIKPNDRIVAVAQGKHGEWVDVVGMPLNKAVSLIRGPKGTEVRLQIMPANDRAARVTVTLVRDEIKLEDAEAKAKVIELPGPTGEPVRLGVIDLPSFYGAVDLAAARGKGTPRSTAADVARLLKKLVQENVQGIVLDLRRNGGGALEEAVRLTGLFIKQGPVVQVRDPDGFTLVEEDRDPSVLYDGPLVVLTSRFSASASEILAGALQDYGRALIVGDISTHGKGTVQSLNELRRMVRNESMFVNDPGSLKLTIRKFYRPSGSSTQLKGVLPDIVLPSVNNVADVGESAADNPLPWDTIENARFERLDRVEPYLAELIRRSHQRVASDPEFGYVREDIEQYKKTKADKTVSLNLAERLKEKEEADARQKARDAERRARKLAEQTMYEITLALADLPGLPPPLTATNSTAATTNALPAEASEAATASADTTPDDPEAELEEPKPDRPDYVLHEAERILLDYLSLLPREAAITAVQPTRPEKTAPSPTTLTPPAP